ncbi:HDOD domain-containing protein [Alkalilimnicola sp. S0819]|uniref:HDOD domain-containing protein n=1 Tax=Alkalilimnicola sp. S0819 TaxID=2613922 RepID=UPI0012621997|nr:HDOD domain-containing protein [Alkalilimnicola sp. S0819]KAB7627504.1 HDOD domain-containing protein [Alkalilimnicola sp. S0819]MPQ15658.1 HDOD domain-containing protein [Alkalilimnicola sp. S0819]
MLPAEQSTDTSLARWMHRLNERDMPVLNNTVQQLCNISTDTGASANDLAAVVLRDASMTSGVLRIANSAHYNRSGREINTISRAVVMLGFDTVRGIGLSQILIDTFLNGEARSHLVGLMRQSVYAAVQAKLIAQQAGDEAPEEIFIAALLYRLGEIAFWAYAGDQEA